ncbi:MAG: DNRLRE domain-containing protein, partial [Planctomycetota bacterium]|nr:DNRLRE domain-containing protein [Planctomycetota bacterium]
MLETLEGRQLLAYTDLTPTDDGYVRGGTYANQNFGNSIELVTKTQGDDNTRHAFMKFSLDQVGTELDGGKIRLYGYCADDSTPNETISVYPVSNLAWDEDAITWNTQPAYDGTTILAQQVVTNYGPSTAKWYEFDVSGYIEQQKALGKTHVSFMLKNEGTSTARVVFNSKEASANGDVLRIETPTPGASTNEPVADAYVRGGTYANDEFGTASTLAVKDDADASGSFDRESYLRFNLGTAPIAGATVRVFGNLPTGTTAPTIGLFAVTDTAWSESAINWSNKPAPSGSALATASVSGSTGQWYEFDVTGYAEQERAAGRSAISFLLKGTSGTNRADFNSREAAVNRPQLVIETTSAQPQLPAAPSTLLATGASATKVNLTWADHSSDETGFKIERKTGAGGTWSQIATVGAGVTSYADT